jgi:predicted AlkP superfamily pyrophosphatase or phosphodiesterase
VTLAARIERAIRRQHIPRLAHELPAGEFIFPAYGGLSIANIPGTIGALLGLRLPVSPPLSRELWEPFAEGVRRVVLVVVDALGYRRFLEVLEGEPDNAVADFRSKGALLVPLTSVFPSTTVSAISTLWTGRTPLEHGFLGYRLFLREFGMRAEMIRFQPAEAQAPDLLVDAGLNPEEFLPVPGLAQLLADYGIPTHFLIFQGYMDSALSRMHRRGVPDENVHALVTSSDMWVLLRQLLEERASERLLVVAYWGAADGISHLRGPDSESLEAEARNLLYSMGREFLSRLSPAAAAGTVLMLTADHGHVHTPLEATVYLKDHPGLTRHLLMRPTGEPRASYLYTVTGERDAARDYIRQHLAEQFVVIESERALAAGLFGAGQPAPETRYRVGNLVVIARRDYILYDRDDEPETRGRHGGLAPEEMLVPFVIGRLDG